MTCYTTELCKKIYWPGYPSKSLYVKHTGHETHDKIATITRVTLGLKSNYISEGLVSHINGVWRSFLYFTAS